MPPDLLLAPLSNSSTLAHSSVVNPPRPEEAPRMSSTLKPGSIAQVLTDRPSYARLDAGDLVEVVSLHERSDRPYAMTTRPLDSDDFVSGADVWAVNLTDLREVPADEIGYGFQIGDRVHVPADAKTATGSGVYFDQATDGEITDFSRWSGDVVVKGTSALGHVFTQHVGPAYLTKIGAALDAYPVGSRVRVLTSGDEYADHDRALPMALFYPAFVAGAEAEVVEHRLAHPAFGDLLRVRFTDGVSKWVRTLQVEPAPNAPEPEPVIVGFSTGDPVVIARGAEEASGSDFYQARYRTLNAVFLGGPDEDGDLVFAFEDDDEWEIGYALPRYVSAAAPVWPPVVGQIVDIDWPSPVWAGPGEILAVPPRVGGYFRVRTIRPGEVGEIGAFAIESLRPQV